MSAPPQYRPPSFAVRVGARWGERGGAPDAPRVPGWTLVEPLGAGATTEAWSAVEAGAFGAPSTAAEQPGAAVLLLARSEAACARADLLAGARHPHLMPVLARTTAEDGRLAVVTRPIGPPLASVAGPDAPPLDPGELAGVLASLGNALGRLHELGLAHGDVSAHNVLVDRDGAVVLADLLEDPEGLAAPVDPVEDVAALARLVLGLAERSDPQTLAAVRRAVAPGLEPRELRCDARLLATGAVTIAPAAALSPRRRPVTARVPAAVVLTPHARRRRRWLPALGAFVAAAGLTGGAIFVLAGGERTDRAASGGRPSATAQGAAAEAPAVQDAPGAQEAREAVPPDVAVAVASLAARRDDALEAGDAGALTEVDAPGSPAWHADIALLEALEARDEKPVGLQSTVTLERVIDGDPAGVRFTLRATLAQAESTRVGPAGESSVPAAPARCVDITLTRADGPLRVHETAPCDVTGTGGQEAASSPRLGA